MRRLCYSRDGNMSRIGDESLSWEMSMVGLLRRGVAERMRGEPGASRVKLQDSAQKSVVV
jgi:hypothetical protein